MFSCNLVLARLVVTILNYILSFISVVLLFIFYAKPEECQLNKFFISFNVLLCLGVSVISVLRKVQVQSTTAPSGRDMYSIYSILYISSAHLWSNHTSPSSLRAELILFYLFYLLILLLGYSLYFAHVVSSPPLCFNYPFKG